MDIRIILSIYVAIGTLLGIVLDNSKKFNYKYCNNYGLKLYYGIIFVWTYPITYFIFKD